MSRKAVFSSGTMRMGPALSPSPLGRVHDSFPRTFDYSSLVASYPTARKVIIPDGLRQSDIWEQGIVLCHFAAPAEFWVVCWSYVCTQGLRNFLKDNTGIPEKFWSLHIMQVPEALVSSAEWGSPKHIICCWWTDSDGKKQWSPTPAVGLKSLGAGILTPFSHYLLNCWLIPMTVIQGKKKIAVYYSVNVNEPWIIKIFKLIRLSPSLGLYHSILPLQN